MDDFLELFRKIITCFHLFIHLGCVSFEYSGHDILKVDDGYYFFTVIPFINNHEVCSNKMFTIVIVFEIGQQKEIQYFPLLPIPA